MKKITTIKLTDEQKTALIKRYGSIANAQKVLIYGIDKNLLTQEEQIIAKYLTKNDHL